MDWIWYHARMELTEAQDERLAPVLPVQRGNVRVSNRHVLHAILYVAEHGGKWRGLPPRFGRWPTINTRMNRWSKTGVLARVFAPLPKEQLVRLKPEAVSMDSPSVKVHPDATGALNKTGPRPSARPGGGWPPQSRLVAAEARTAVTVSRSPGQAHEAPEGRKLLHRLGAQREPVPLMLTGPTRATRPTGWRGGWGSIRWGLRARPGSTLGHTIGSCTNGATKLNGCSSG